MPRLLGHLLIAVSSAFTLAASAMDAPTPAPAAEVHDGGAKEQRSVTQGTVTVGGKVIAYTATAGTIVLENDKGEAIGSMFYVAYTKNGVTNPGQRPVTFFYNGGPGSSSIWLHMGAFGPRRVVTADHSHTPAAPYEIADNGESLLDATDEVFIDAMGTGFSRIVGKGDPKDFYGVDPDARAFAQFITKYLSEYGRWNSPKYLFGESYGTTRTGALAYDLQSDYSVDLNGIVLLSSILNWTIVADFPEVNPGVEESYVALVPSFAATAWYHHKLPSQPAELKPFLDEVEAFAAGDYAQALAAGATLTPEAEHKVAERLHAYTGLPVDYLLKARLRVTGPEFEHELLLDAGEVVGRFDSRYTGPVLDPLDRDAEYDPQSVAISGAYTAAFNDYARKELKFGEGMSYLPLVNGLLFKWNFDHKQPGIPFAYALPNVLPDLAATMSHDPDLKVMLNSGYLDLATPYYSQVYNMRQLPMAPELQKNISYAFYTSGHMVYANQESLKQLHDNVARFIEANQGK